MDPETAIQIVNTDWTTLIPQLGFGAIIFGAFMFLLKWVLKTQEKILDNSKDERVTAQKVNEGYLKTIEQMSIQSSEFHRQVTEAHNYQRSEHEKIMDGLEKVCTVSTQNAACLGKINDNLDEQGKALARINGFKRE